MFGEHARQAAIAKHGSEEAAIEAERESYKKMMSYGIEDVPPKVRRARAFQDMFRMARGLTGDPAPVKPLPFKSRRNQ